MNALLTTEQGRALNRVVSDLLVQTESNVVLLTDIGGNILTQAPNREDRNLPTMAALAAGAFAATRELALLTGETGFRCVSHEGDQAGLFVHSVGADGLLVIVFQRTTTLGLVKLYARKAAEELAPMLAVVMGGTQAHPESMPAFELCDADKPVFALPEPAASPRTAALRAG
jgi:predicted regulator of Ras-like GTPase activity (Roadblock/LC7/MglB family)